MALDISVYANIGWGKLNGVAFADTQSYNNDENIYLLKDVFTDAASALKDGRNYTVILQFEGDVEIGYLKTIVNDDGSTTQELVGKVLVPARSPVSIQTQYAVSALLNSSFLAFKNASSIDSTTKSSFEVNMLVLSAE